MTNLGNILRIALLLLIVGVVMEGNLQTTDSGRGPIKCHSYDCEEGLDWCRKTGTEPSPCKEKLTAADSDFDACETTVHIDSGMVQRRCTRNLKSRDNGKWVEVWKGTYVNVCTSDGCNGDIPDADSVRGPIKCYSYDCEGGLDACRKTGNEEPSPCKGKLSAADSDFNACETRVYIDSGIVRRRCTRNQKSKHFVGTWMEAGKGTYVNVCDSDGCNGDIPDEFNGGGITTPSYCVLVVLGILRLLELFFMTM